MEWNLAIKFAVSSRYARKLMSTVQAPCLHCTPVRWLRPLNSIRAPWKVQRGKHRHALGRLEEARWENSPCVLIRTCQARCMSSPQSARGWLQYMNIQWGGPRRLYCSFFFLLGVLCEVRARPLPSSPPPPPTCGHRWQSSETGLINSRGSETFVNAGLR